MAVWNPEGETRAKGRTFLSRASHPEEFARPFFSRDVISRHAQRTIKAKVVRLLIVYRETSFQIRIF